MVFGELSGVAMNSDEAAQQAAVVRFLQEAKLPAIAPLPGVMPKRASDSLLDHQLDDRLNGHRAGEVAH
jgi:hypothetical protein